MPLQPFAVSADPAPLPPAVAKLLADGAARIDEHFQRAGEVRGAGCVPSDHELVYRTLCGLRAALPDARSFLEWGSGSGVVTGLAALLGFEAHGIEIDPQLADLSRRLLRDHRLPASIVCGSFVPDADEDRACAPDADARTVWSGPCAYAGMDRDLDEFDVVFAFPWPAEEAHYRRLFLRHADYGAVLACYTAGDGVQLFRKVGKRTR